ncbi:MAG: hypothetical protein H6Q42_1706 [Deltaproteobacteria bacterium]|nr:hypothetical protein [Deltaproteobacteria bacterium]
MIHKSLAFLRNLLIPALILTLWGGVLGQEIGPAKEQDFLDGKNAVEAAQKAQAEKYAPEPLKQAQDLLAAANEARSQKDPVKFSQASRLGRAYAELAKAAAELKAEEEKLALAQEELQKARADLDRLKKSSP